MPHTHTRRQSQARTRERSEEDPTWLEHTLDIKDDQNKGSQTSGKHHPAYPAHPHQLAQSLFHVGTESLGGLGGCRLLCVGIKGRSVGGSGVSAGTDEDCSPVNELNASESERTTAGCKRGRRGLGARGGGTSPCARDGETEHEAV